MTAELAIELQGVQKRFGRVPVLRGIDLRVQRGEFLGLVGPNGAGKSTILRILIGLYRRSEGRCLVFSLDPDHDALTIRARTSYLPGETSVYQQMTGESFLRFAQSFHRGRDREVEQRLVELFALPLQARVRSYSAGMKQKLAILAALSVEADLYVLDEPDRALDATMRMEVRDVLRDLHRAGKTLLLSSHHLEELQALTTRLAFLRSGEIIAASEIEAARTKLHRRFRLRLSRDVALPGGAVCRSRETDGTMVLEVDGPPAAFLQALPADAIASAQLGSARLEDLYELLFLHGPSATDGALS
ncbi:MAG: ABC transporter ATP-binding protein [Planctomycetota bacterium]